MSSRELPTTLTANGLMVSGSFSRTSRSARSVCAVTRTRLPWASRCASNAAAV